MYFLRGCVGWIAQEVADAHRAAVADRSLPWQGIKAKNKKQKYERIMEKKISVPVRTHTYVTANPGQPTLDS